MKKKEEEGLVVASLVSLVIARHRQSLLSTTTTSNSAQHVQESSLSSSSSSFWSKFKERMGRQEQAEEAGEGEFDVVAAFDAWSTQTLLQLSTHLGLKQEEFEMISLDLPKSSGISAEIQALKLVETGNGPSNFPGIVMILLLATTLSSAQSSSLLARYDSRLRSVLREVGRLLHVSSVSPALSLEASEAIAADCLSETANNYKNTSGDVVSTNSNPSQDQNQEQQQESSDRDKADRFKRIATIGIVSAAATITLAVSGGLAAPLIGTGLVSILSGMGVAGGAAAAAGLASAAGIGIVTTLFGVAGGGITAWKMKTRFSDVKEFSFHQILMAKRMVDESLRPPLPPRVSSRPYDITTTSVPPLNATPSNAADTTTSVSSSPIHPPSFQPTRTSLVIFKLYNHHHRLHMYFHPYIFSFVYRDGLKMS